MICVGTTSCRTIESAAAEDGTLRPCSGWTEIFIYPGYQFKVLDCLITNFHLPESTLLMLVSALGRKREDHDRVQRGGGAEISILFVWGCDVYKIRQEGLWQ